MTSVNFPLLKGKPDVQFRFTIPHAQELERVAGCGIQMIAARMQSVHALVLMVCYGLKWKDPRMTQDKAAGYIQDFIDNGGDTVELYKAVEQALLESGVYGKPKDSEGAENPQTETETIPA